MRYVTETVIALSECITLKHKILEKFALKYLLLVVGYLLASDMPFACAIQVPESQRF